MNNDTFSSELKKLEEKNLLRKPVTFDNNDGRTVTHNGKSYLLFCSNDYLGLSHHPEVVNAVRDGLEKYGAGSGASRLVSGTTTPHTELENRLKEYLAREAALVFSSGYAANVGIIPAIADKEDMILADRLNHASLVDGCLLSRAGFKRYPHFDMVALEKLLADNRKARRRWIITDGLFSMDGDIAPLPEICGLAKKYDAYVYLDDAHAFGVLGANGRGTPELHGVEGSIDILMGTFGKAGGGMGAFAAGSHTIIDYLANSARTFLFSTAMPPAYAQGSLKAVEILMDFDNQRKMFLDITESFHKRLAGIGLDIFPQTYIIPVVLGDAGNALRASRLFWDEGVYIQAIRPPTVPDGSSRLRITLSLAHADEDRQKVINLMSNKLSVLIGTKGE